MGWGRRLIPVFAVLGLPNVVSATIVVALVAVVFRRRVFGRIDRVRSSWVDAWLKALVILVGVTFLGVYVPSWILQTGPVTRLHQPARDLVGAGTWGVAFVAILTVLYLAHRESRV